MAEYDKQRLLFGQFFQGLDKPLKTFAVQSQVESPRAFVTRHKILNGTYTVDDSERTVATTEQALRATSLYTKFGIVRFGFVNRHLRSLHRRWYFCTRTRRNMFPGGPVPYLLGL
ncbi:hypothetical protein NP590_11285 [Methylomonas sp. SURF-2]|uniref:Uncharacterized protein n=1 Tax=Methylomonas subterranea TaxID=2952225 RepID=A0ABT1TGV4_9GAMM|nr:hypothetical protein [Methylomonas sp. SURF-2]MCQ8104690.1 hypothetical protein [Methylomonas sp. SURF-2]